MPQQSFIAGPFTPATSFIAANTTKAKILVDQCLGGLTLPDNGAIEAKTRGGCQVIGGAVSSTDGSDKNLMLYVGQLLTTQEAAVTGDIAIAASSITRTTAAPGNGFIYDGWLVGDLVMIFGPVGTADGNGTPRPGASMLPVNAGIVGTVTAVSNTVLTVDGTPFSTEATLPLGSRLFRVALRTVRKITADSGTDVTTPAVQLVGGSQDADLPVLPDTALPLGINSVLIGAMESAVSSLPAAVHVAPIVMRY